MSLYGELNASDYIPYAEKDTRNDHEKTTNRRIFHLMDLVNGAHGSLGVDILFTPPKSSCVITDEYIRTMRPDTPRENHHACVQDASSAQTPNAWPRRPDTACSFVVCQDNIRAG